MNWTDLTHILEMIRIDMHDGAFHRWVNTPDRPRLMWA